MLNTTRDPIEAFLAAPEDAVLAIIAGVEGPSYRPVGATMTVFTEFDRVGTLSSGCVESDISLHAMEARDQGDPKLLRYGQGSPFADIQLPCGGGLDILLLPHADRGVMAELMTRRDARIGCTLVVDTVTGSMHLQDSGATGRSGDTLLVRFDPDLRFVVFGKGPEASTFSTLVHSAGYPTLLLSPDSETLDDGKAAGCDVQHMVSAAFPDTLTLDDRTAVVLFFHDHEWEPPIMAGALETPAFYIGAQGSQRARDARMLILEGMGVTAEARARLYGPVGLIQSARDAGTLAVSVLAQILDVAMQIEREKVRSATKTGGDNELLGTV